MSEHFIPFRKLDVLRLAGEGAPTGFGRVAALLGRVLGQEFQERLERIKELYQPLDPNRDTQPAPGGSEAKDPAGFTAALKELLERANYRALSDAELQEAFTSESVFRVKLHTELSDFQELTIYARGKRRRQEVIRTLFGLRKRTIDVDFYERVLINIRFQEEAHFPEKRRKKLLFTPGTTQLKLFANVPAADLEMLFPNSEVRMKTLDKIMIGVPAAIGVVGMATKVIAVLTFMWIGLHWVGQQTRVYDGPVDQGKLTAEAGIVIGACVAIYLFIGRQLMRYRFKKLQFIKALADNLYFRNLDNNAGAFHRVIDDAQEEDVKEAVLAYRFLAVGPATAAELDATVERWFADTLKTTVDFEVEDGLGKLERLGLASCSGDTWTALPPAAAEERLRSLWSNAAG